MSCDRMSARVVRWRELDDAERTHALRCADCRRELDALENAITRAAADHAQIDPSRSERLRMRLLDSARREAPVRPWRPARAVAAAIALVAVVSLGVVVSQRDASPTSTAHGAVRASSGAQFTVIGDAPDEIVRLIDGTISVAVEPLPPGARFRVVVGDAEVEVRGTAFDVSATDDRLVAVDVLHGRVEVRVDAQPLVVLDGGQRWTPPPVVASAPEPVATTETALDEARDVVPAAPPIEHARPSARPWTAATGFEDGWTALHAGDPAHAAEAFERVMERSPTDPLAEDAAFWRCVALSRTGDSRAADRALDAFVHRYPTSARAGEASVMLGWLRVGSGETDTARSLFERGAQDPTERIRASARRGLDRLAATP
jgi:ferric-dicitrate binding protein FerR (iron transport regulator)